MLRISDEILDQLLLNEIIQKNFLEKKEGMDEFDIIGYWVVR